MSDERSRSDRDGFEAHRAELLAQARSILGSIHDAQDAVQDVSIRWLAQCRDTLPERPRAWLRRTLANRAVDLIRARCRRRDRAEAFPRMAPPGNADAPADHATPEDAAERSELRAAVAEALGRLTEPQRYALTAKEYEGLAFAQIARDLDVALPTAKTHYLRALDALRRHLPPAFRPEPAQGDPKR